RTGKRLRHLARGSGTDRRAVPIVIAALTLQPEALPRRGAAATVPAIRGDGATRAASAWA
ncbi:MAG: hypothetical protein NTW37_01545, partial [Proteobacteria bacterium]|nr:hypothetical protein [Pseudomonadota bacterium]